LGGVRGTKFSAKTGNFAERKFKIYLTRFGGCQGLKKSRSDFFKHKPIRKLRDAHLKSRSDI